MMIFTRIHRWLKKDGFVLISMESGEYDDEMGEWLGVPMFISSFGQEVTIHLMRQAGFEILKTAVESQREGEVDIPFLWMFAQKK
jgi:hypothetical protein